MLRKRRVLDHGSTDLLPGQILDRFAFDEENRRVTNLGGKPATAEVMLLGITEASLQTESFLSAASFQKTTKVLTEAAIRGKSDPLRGLKENVIIGRLIPAGSGMATYKETQVGLADPSQDIRISDFDTGIFVDGDFGFGEMDEEEDSEALEHLDAALPGIGGGGDGDAKDDDDAASDDDVDASEGEDEEIAGDLYDDEEPSDSDDEDDIEAADDADDDTE